MSDKYITKIDDSGSINIAEDVVITLVLNSVSEVDGFCSFANTAGAELAEFVGLKTIPKGVRVNFDGGKTVIDVIITVKYGFNIVKVAEDVQQEVLSAIQSIAGIDECEVNVHVSGISFDK